MTGNVWFTSDIHFGHKRILELTDRGKRWSHVEDMDEDLIRTFNELVRPGDRVYHLGDFSFASNERTKKIKRRLMGEWHWVLGNHDNSKDRDLYAMFQWVGDYRRVKLDAQAIVLFHYPIMSWHGMHKGAWHLHGHCHGNLTEACRACGTPFKALRLDVGIDNHPYDFRPFSYEEVRQHMRTVGTSTTTAPRLG
jgi:calcineurin-like phosphoesterase family protein